MINMEIRITKKEQTINDELKPDVYTVLTRRKRGTWSLRDLDNTLEEFTLEEMKELTKKLSDRFLND